MDATRRAAHTPLLERWRRHLRRGCDEGSASMVSYIVAAAVFITGSTLLFNFLVEPPGADTSNLEHATLKAQAHNALSVLLGTPGYPAAWEATQQGVDEDLERLGILEPGSSLRVDSNKFDALARGKYATSSSTNGYVDYAEAKTKLGIGDNEFHLRAFPLIRPVGEGSYGTEGMADYRVAYVGRIDSAISWHPAAEDERDALAAIGLGFDPDLRSASLTGDVYMDTSTDVRLNLMPNIGAQIHQTVLSNGAGTKYDFHRVPASTYDALTVTTGESGAMALAQDDAATLGYTKSRELRAIVGKAEMGVQQSATLQWREFVDTDRANGTYDCGDYGFVEYSRDDGLTWTALTNSDLLRSQDCDVLPAIPHGPALKPRTVELECGAACGTVLLAFHWVADNDNDVGYGWVVDDVMLGLGPTYVGKTFEKPEYDMVIIGSEVDHNAFTPDDVKDAIRDYVDVYGGRLVVLGGQTNVNWLDRLFDVGVGGSSGGISVPDTTHPLLTLPNPLAHETYPTLAPGEIYSVSGQDASLFSVVIGGDDETHALSVAREGAWGSGTTRDGSVVLSSYKPYQLEPEEIRRFMANTAVYGKFHYLYLEVGPPIPDDIPVASVSRTATMNMYREGEANYTEMAFIMYVWPGVSGDATSKSASIQPLAPQGLTATAAPGEVNVDWNPLPADSWGTGVAKEYRLYRGNSPHSGTLIATLAHDADTSHVDTASVVDGTTYYYAVRAVSTYDDTGDPDPPYDLVSPPSDEVSVTPMSPPGAPTDLAAETKAGYVELTWTPSAATGGGTILGYRLYVDNDTDGSFEILAEVGSSTSYNHVVPHTNTMDFQVRAVNGYDEGAASATASGAAGDPILPPTLLVTSDSPGNLTLTFAAPVQLHGQTPTGWRIYRSATEEGTYDLLAETAAGNVSFIDVGLGASATWWYKVGLVTDVDETAPSLATGATTMAVPGAPIVTATRVLTTATISWTAPLSDAAIVRYDLYKGPTAETATEFVKSVSEATLLTTDTYDAAQKFYAVRAVSAAGVGAWSNADDASI